MKWIYLDTCRCCDKPPTPSMPPHPLPIGSSVLPDSVTRPTGPVGFELYPPPPAPGIGSVLTDSGDFWDGAGEIQDAQKNGTVASNQDTIKKRP